MPCSQGTGYLRKKADEQTNFESRVIGRKVVGHVNADNAKIRSFSITCHLGQSVIYLNTRLSVVHIALL